MNDNRSISAKGQRNRFVALLIFDILTATVGFGLVFVAVGHDANSATECTSLNGLCVGAPQVSLGVWKNFPPISSCDVTAVPNNVTAKVCELMGNSSYRGVLPGGFAGYSVGLSVGCISPSVPTGLGGPGFLQLQYAIYTQIGETNSSNWQSVGSSLQIDGATNPCPGNDVSPSGALNTTTTGYIFRVVGADGGGPGDNPRFSSIGVTIFQTVVRTFGAQYSIIGVTSFTAIVTASVPVLGNQLVNFRWFATNVSSTNPSCGHNAAGNDNVCWQRGASSATIPTGGFFSSTVTVTYPTAFTGTVTAILQITSTAPQGVPAVLGEVSLLKAQTLTV